MKLYENIAYEKKGKKYSKFSVTIPKKAIKALKWRKGDILNVEVNIKGVIIRKTKKPEMEV